MSMPNLGLPNIYTTDHLKYVHQLLDLYTYDYIIDSGQVDRFLVWLRSEKIGLGMWAHQYQRTIEHDRLENRLINREQELVHYQEALAIVQAQWPSKCKTLN